VVSVRVENISKRFGKVEALKRVDLLINSGEFFAILGPSGCGKTTLLRIIAGLEKPTTGRVYFDDVDVTDYPAEYRNIGMVFQFYALYPTTVYNNIALPLKSKGYSGRELDKRVREIAELVGLVEKLSHHVDKLSVAEKQKTALARAIAKEPNLFLLDEPLTILDPVSRIIMRNELKRIQRELKQTIIYVTHDQIEALTLSDRIAVMNFGIVEQVDEPVRIYSRPRNTYVGWFLGEPGMNFIEVSVTEDGLVLGDRVVYPDKKLSSQLLGKGFTRVLLGFRGEDAVLARSIERGVGDRVVIPSRISVIEFFGTHYVLTLESGSQEFKVKYSTGEYAKLNPAVGDSVYSIVDPGHVNLYDQNGVLIEGV